MSFISFEQETRSLIDQIVENSLLHGMWLNTLSYLENCGARKIASCEHPTAVKEEMLKHAAEEFRHALYLKQQLSRIGQNYIDYRSSSLLGGSAGYRYINALDLYTVRYLQALGKSSLEIRALAYLLVTYAIELRAAEVYPLYQSALKRQHSKVQVQSILLEEKEHLREMEAELSRVQNASVHVEYVCAIEANFFKKWLICCAQESFAFQP